jgi:hypothetical protein
MQGLGGELRERIRWAGCGVIAGLIMGMVLGWMFHGFVGAIIKIGIVLIFLVPLVAAVLFFLSSRRGSGGKITIQDVNWRDLGGRRRDQP